jgi:hypothetical protein
MATSRTQSRSAGRAPTLGLVTALPEEFQAARVLLGAPVHTRVAEDRADYIVGSLPSLEPGLDHTVARSLLRAILAGPCRSGSRLRLTS